MLAAMILGSVAAFFLNQALGVERTGLRTLGPLPGALPPIATHSSEIQYLFDQPNTPFPATLNAGQEALASTMRAAWASFAATGDPGSHDVPWPSIGHHERVLSFAQPSSVVEDNFASSHHCGFWAAG